jgi:two-component system nitrate/nitrite sensor histidine kinase NarX
LRAFQWGALFLTLAIVSFALWFAKRRVVMPLRQLLISAGAAGRGDFSRRTPFTGGDELGRLGIAFNDMSATLSKLYADLEERVRVKTLDLEQSNRSLDVLYKTVKRLSGTPFPHVIYRELLEEITALAGTGPAAICLTGVIETKAHQLATTRARARGFDACQTSDCSTCLGQGETHFFARRGADGSLQKVMSLPIRDLRHHHGVLLVEARAGKGFADWQVRVLEAVASHIAIAITMSSLHAEQSRVALLTERSAIARELHDSLAQSLSYAKIQVSRLDKVLADTSESGSAQKKQAQEISDELRDGLNRAYRELRELLTTFRLTMEDHDLNRSIADTVEEFNQRGAVIISFASHCPNGLLAPNEEIHVLQIIRVALANIINHSKLKNNMN